MSIRKLSAPTMMKRWSITSCATSTASIITNLLDDAQLHADLLTHIKTMITRVRYQIMIPNPLLDNIKQHYPMAWDMTLAAVSSWGKYTPYTISENEIGFLVLHIGVGLERHYNIGYQRQPQVLLVCDTSNAMVRMIEAILQRKYPQLEIAATISQREYEQRDAIEADFVISTVRIGRKRQAGGDHRAVPHRTISWIKSASWCWWTVPVRGC
ncbi:BglB-family transcriptional antiterminator [Klebsiella pneumoniae]|uniref:BglB-family transcriptional antiterminator n=1 Tax=Klebsiella pneumoniae TaxID=573 RepID=A0A378FUC9_KLEPN|nr:BglB-family transcriptional antiterminator [Klebsiella pneumoniae]